MFATASSAVFTLTIIYDIVPWLQINEDRPESPTPPPSLRWIARRIAYAVRTTAVRAEPKTIIIIYDTCIPIGHVRHCHVCSRFGGRPISFVAPNVFIVTWKKIIITRVLFDTVFDCFTSKLVIFSRVLPGPIGARAKLSSRKKRLDHIDGIIEIAHTLHDHWKFVHLIFRTIDRRSCSSVQAGWFFQCTYLGNIVWILLRPRSEVSFRFAVCLKKQELFWIGLVYTDKNVLCNVAMSRLEW